ncbi:AraC family transcriptional regulator [Pendulispora rubella]|uniref:AraC family transcriptional regulator n=1 Tax=Pendulispora rubella TaxID=2741070 RepID=A0ABZ2KSZ2_9BACT
MARWHNVGTELWYAADLGGAELLRGSFVDYTFDVHSHGTACFALVTKGAIRIRTQGHDLVARAGDLYAIDAEKPHAGWPVDPGGWSLRTIHVDTERLKAMIGGEGPRVSLAGPILRDAMLVKWFTEIHRQSEMEGPPLEREERYLEFIARLLARHTRAPPRIAPPRHEPRSIRLAREYLEQRIDQRVRLDDIAAAAALPPFRLYRAFERAMGMSPHAYQRQARIRLAAQWLREGRAIRDVANASGFADQAHLTRSFRRTMGVTPGAYKAAFARGSKAHAQ